MTNRERARKWLDPAVRPSMFEDTVSSLAAEFDAVKYEAWESAKRAAADYCENVLAANHPHLAEAYRHAAHNIRAAVSPPREGEPE